MERWGKPGAPGRFLDTKVAVGLLGAQAGNWRWCRRAGAPAGLIEAAAGNKTGVRRLKMPAQLDSK